MLEFARHKLPAIYDFSAKHSHLDQNWPDLEATTPAGRAGIPAWSLVSIH